MKQFYPRILFFLALTFACSASAIAIESKSYHIAFDSTDTKSISTLREYKPDLGQDGVYDFVISQDERRQLDRLSISYRVLESETRGASAVQIGGATPLAASSLSATDLNCGATPNPVKWNKLITLTAKLRKCFIFCSPLSGRAVTINFNGRSYNRTTNTDGIVSVTVGVPSSPGPYGMTATFAGDSNDGPASCSKSITVQKRNSSLSLPSASPTTVCVGSQVTFSSTLRDTDALNAGIPGKTVRFQRRSGFIFYSWTDVCTDVTNASGVAVCSWTANEQLSPSPPSDSGSVVDVSVSGARQTPGGTEFEVTTTTTDAAGVASAQTQTFRARFNGDSKYNSSESSNRNINVNTPACTQLSCDAAPNPVKWGRPVTLKARLRNCGLFGSAIPNKSITLSLNGQTQTGSTGADGRVSRAVTAPSTPGTYTMTASFVDNSPGCGFASSNCSKSITVQKRNSSISIPTASPGTVCAGDQVTFSSSLKDTDAGNNGIVGRTVHFQRRSGFFPFYSWSDVCTDVTNNLGNASCVWTASEQFSPSPPSDSGSVVETSVADAGASSAANEFDVTTTTTDAAGNVSVQTQKFRAKFNGDSKYNSSESSTRNVTVNTPVCTKLNCSETPGTVIWGKNITLKAQLKQCSLFFPPSIANKPVKFVFNGQTKTATTGSDGRASAVFAAPSTPGSHTMSASFVDNAPGCGLASSSCSKSITVQKRNTSLFSVTISPALVCVGDVVNFSTTLTDTDNSGSPISGRTIHFQRRSGFIFFTWTDVCTDVTDAGGVARCAWNATEQLSPSPPSDSGSIVDVSVSGARQTPEGSEFEVTTTTTDASGATSVQTQTFRARFNGDSKYNSSESTSKTLTVNTPVCTKLNCSETPGTAIWGKNIVLKAQLKECGLLFPPAIANKPIKFVFNGQTKTATTGSDGRASAVFAAPTTPGNHTMTASFVDNAPGCGFASSSCSKSITVTKRNTSLVGLAISPTLVCAGDDVNFSATFLDSDNSNSPISGRTVKFQRCNAILGLCLTWTNVCTGVTDAGGVARCVWTSTQQLSPAPPSDSGSIVDVTVSDAVPSADGGGVEFEVTTTATDAAGNTSVQTQKFRARFDGDSRYNSSESQTKSATVNTPSRNSRLTCDIAPVLVHPYPAGQTVTASVVLEECGLFSCNPIANKPVDFVFNGETKSATTGANGTASVNFPVPANPGKYTMRTSFVDGGCAFRASACSKQVEVGGCETSGDANSDTRTNIADVQYLVSWLFLGGAAPPNCAQGDANGDGRVNISDANNIISWLFRGGATPICGPVNMGC